MSAGRWIWSPGSYDELACPGKNQKLALQLQWILPWWSICIWDGMAISLRQSYGKASAAIPLACMEDTVKVSGVQVQHCSKSKRRMHPGDETVLMFQNCLVNTAYVRAIKTVDRIDVIRTSFKRWNLIISAKPSTSKKHAVWIVCPIRKDRSICFAAFETKEYFSKLKWKFESTFSLLLQIWQDCFVIMCWSSECPIDPNKEFQVGMLVPLTATIKRKPFLGML